MNTFYPGEDDKEKTETPAQIPPPEVVVQDNVITEDVITTDDEDDGRGVTSVPDPKRKGK